MRFNEYSSCFRGKRKKKKISIYSKTKKKVAEKINYLVTMFNIV